MKRTRPILFCLLAATSAGCSGQGYWTDRGRDALDIFTITYGVGAGAGARVGPLHAGLGAYFDGVGMRGGTVNIWEIPHGTPSFTIETTVYSWEIFYPQGHRGHPDDRNKSFEPVGYPFVSYIPSITIGTGEKAAERPPSYSYYTQIDAFAGALGGLRVGFNPGELVDFLLGWTTLDLYNDDLGARPPEQP